MKTEKKYQICNNCVMDTSDPKITFDLNGVCDFCNNYYSYDWRIDKLILK